MGIRKNADGSRAVACFCCGAELLARAGVDHVALATDEGWDLVFEEAAGPACLAGAGVRVVDDDGEADAGAVGA